MSKPFIKIHNVQTGEVIEREMNDSEFTQWQEDQARNEARIQAEQEKAIAKTALLNKLGITEEEAKLLVS